MEDNEEEEGGELTPFWLQNKACRRSGVSSFFSFSLAMVVILLFAAAVLFFVIVGVPTIFSFTSPNSVKKSWDSLNIVLLLLAVMFGYLTGTRNESHKSNPSTPNKGYNYTPSEEGQTPNSRYVQWFQESDFQTKLEHRNAGMMRSSSSYPDLRQFQSADWPPYEDYYQRRSDDYLDVEPGRGPDTGKRRPRRHRSLEEVTSTVVVDTLQMKLEKAANCPPQRFEGNDDTNEIEQRREEKYRRRVKRNPEFSNFTAAAAAMPPSPPPQLQRRNTSEKNRYGATGSATKDFLNSFYHKKKNKQRQKSVENLDSLLHEAQVPRTFQFLPQSPPPPPVFGNLFSVKKQKKTRTIKVKLKHLPQPEPNPNPQTASLTYHKPPKPIQLHRFEKINENSNSGGESPMNNIPPPPPPLPAFCKSPAWKFAVQGDYVRVNSTTSSRSSSVDPDEVDSDATLSTTDGGDITPSHPSPLFCPSPDVNTKADRFITNFRAKLKLEKTHFKKKRYLGLSSLGPKPGPVEV